MAGVKARSIAYSEDEEHILRRLGGAVMGDMPIEPKGVKRPADVFGAATRAAKIAMGEIEEEIDDPEAGKDKAPSRWGARAARHGCSA